MTCIAVIKNKRGKLVMSGDRLASSETDVEFCPYSKIKKVNNFLIGGAGRCSLLYLLLKGFTPSYDGRDATTYLLTEFKYKLDKFLKQQGYTDANKLLKIKKNIEMSLLVGYKGKLFLVVLDKEETEDQSSIEIEECSLPYALGSGDVAAKAVLLAENKREGYSTKEHLILAMQIACEISPGCGLINNKPDIIHED